MHTTGVAKEKRGRAPATEVLTRKCLIAIPISSQCLILLGNSLSLRSDIVFCDVWEHGSALAGELSTGLEEEEVPLVGRATEGQSSKEELKGHMDYVPCADSNVECTDIEGMGLTAEVWTDSKSRDKEVSGERTWISSGWDSELVTGRDVESAVSSEQFSCWGTAKRCKRGEGCWNWHRLRHRQDRCGDRKHRRRSAWKRGCITQIERRSRKSRQSLMHCHRTGWRGWHIWWSWQIHIIWQSDRRFPDRRWSIGENVINRLTNGHIWIRT